MPVPLPAFVFPPVSLGACVCRASGSALTSLPPPSVLFQDALRHVPAGAVVLEVAPHCLLQAILKRSLPQSCTVLGLNKRSASNNVQFFLQSVGA